MRNILILISTMFFLSGCSYNQSSVKITHIVDKKAEFYSLKTAMVLNEEELVDALKVYKVIMIGDHHGEDDLHKKIASLIDVLSKDGTKVILANEWFYPSDLDVLQKFQNKDINESQFLKEIDWSKRFKRYKYSSYSPIYEAVINNGGKLYGINISKKSRKKISDQNLSAMSADELLFNNSLDLEVQPHKDLVMPYLSHCHAPKENESLQECAKRMYRVQVAWDSAMAKNSYELYKNLKNDEKLIIFAGSMHIANYLGLPLRFARISNTRVATIIPSQTRKIENDLGDYIVFYKSKPKKAKN